MHTCVLPFNGLTHWACTLPLFYESHDGSIRKKKDRAIQNASVSGHSIQTSLPTKKLRVKLDAPCEVKSRAAAWSRLPNLTSLEVRLLLASTATSLASILTRTSRRDLTANQTIFTFTSKDPRNSLANMPSKKAPEKVWVVVGPSMVNYLGVYTMPTVQGVYADFNSANEAAAGFGGHGHVAECPVNYTSRYGASINCPPAILLTHESISTNTANVDTDTKSKTKTPKTPKTEKDANGESATKRASTKTTVPDGITGSLDGLKLVFTGTFTHMDHKTCVAATEKHGGEIVTKLTESDFVVLGTKPGPKKVEEITKEGLRTMTEEEFYARIGADFEPPAKKAKKA